MRLRSRFVTCLAIAALALVPACGSGAGGGISGQVRIGPYTFALPFSGIDSSEGYTVGLKNQTSLAATVYVTPYMPSGVAYAGGTSPVVIPPHGEVRSPLAFFLGAIPAGGWICVETRDVTTFDAVTGEPTPTATSGYVIPYLHRQNTSGILGFEESALQGITSRTADVTIPVNNSPTSLQAVQLVNYSFTPVGGGPVTPAPVTFDVTPLDAFGVAITPPVAVPVPAYGSVIAPVPVAFDAVGSLHVTPTAPAPPGVEIRFMASALELGRHDAIPARYHEVNTNFWPGQLDVAFDVEYGPDAAGSIHDFGVLVNNPTTNSLTVVLRQIFTLGGAPQLGAPRTYIIRPKGTVFLRTTTTRSRGLNTNAGETSFFDDIFGDVFLETQFREVSLWMQVPKQLNISARHFDASMGSFYRVLKAIPISNLVCVSDVPIQQTLLTQLRNEVRVTNPFPNEVRIPVRGFTPGGTEYILPDLMIPGHGYATWTPDGQIFREDPSDPLGNPVPYMQFMFSPTSGLFFRGRTTFRQAVPATVLFITPQNTRAN